MVINQYDIVLVNLDPTVGSEIRKTRPCVIISPNEMNNHLQTVIIAPMTTAIKNYPTRVKIKHNSKEGQIALDQIRTIDKKRLLKIAGHLLPRTISKLKDVLHEMLVA